jgi:uncharacterized membrane protein
MKPHEKRGELGISFAAILLALFYLVTSLDIAAHRLLWFDEIGTVMFARLPGVVTIWKMAGVLDRWGMPAPYYILVHASQRLLGPTEVAARLPSALAIIAGLLIVFDCTRRLTDGLHGLVAVALLTCSFLPYYAFEARSYGLYFLFASLSLWVWIHAANTKRPIALFAAIFFCGFMMHPYMVLCLAPYGAWDLWGRRLLSGKVIAGAVGALCAVAILSIHISAAAKSGQFPGNHPSLSALLEVFSQMFPNGTFLLALAIIWIALVGASEEVKRPPSPAMQPAERVGWLFLLIPLAGYVVAKLVTNAFDARYFIGTLPGVALASACLLWRCLRSSRLVAIGLLSLFASAGIVKQLDLLRHSESMDWPYGQQTRTRQMLGLEETLDADGKQFILIPANFLYREAHYYSRHPEKYRYLEPDNATYRIPAYFAGYYSLKTWNLEDLKAHARETAVISPPSEVLEAMKQAGFVADTRFTSPIEVVYLK